MKTSLTRAGSPLAALFAAAVLVVSSAVPAQASGGPDLDGIRARLADAGVDTQTQDRLMAKLLAGEDWDSVTGAEPVSERTEIVGDQEVTTRIYADGSPAISSIEVPQVIGSSGAPRSVSGCREGAGAGNFPFYDCRVQTNTALYSITFLSDGRRSSIGQAQVTNYRQIGYWTGAATVNSTRFNLVRRDQSGTSPAHVQGSLYVTFLLGSGSGVYSLSFYVRDTSRWDSTP